jgi:hypothetical protein
MLCPCWYGVPELMKMDQGWCASPLLIRIESGNCDGVDVGGLNVIVGTFFPGPTLFDGAGTARLYFDPSTTEGQRAALQPVLQGQRGGPMSVVAGLTSTWLDAVITEIQVSENGDTVTASVPGYGGVKSSQLRNEAGIQMTMSNVGFTDALEFEGSTAVLAPSAGTSWSDPELPESFECKSGAVGKIHWSGD